MPPGSRLARWRPGPRNRRLPRIAGPEVAEDVVGRLVVGHEQVEPPVAVEVGRDHPQPLTMPVVDAGFFRDVDEPAAVVAEEVIRQRRESLRVAQYCVAASRRPSRAGCSASHSR